MKSWFCAFVIIFLFLARPVFAQELDSGIYQFLVNQRNVHTGIPASFINTDDTMLDGQAATYDLAIAGLGFLQLKDRDSARKILEFFEGKWNQGGLCNFYNIQTGACGIETTVHLGPNMWVATLALQYTFLTKDRRFYPLAKKIALWGIALNHKGGGISMGPYLDWGADWPNVFGAESNIVAYSVFRAIAKGEGDAASKVSMELEMQGIRNFLNEGVLLKGSDGRLQNILVGHSALEGTLMITACDVVSMMLLVFDPKELVTFFALQEEDLLNFARERFIVEEDGIRGFDFSDQEASQATLRPRMISLEWTMQMACALRHISDVYGASADYSGDQEKINRYRKEASFYAKEIDKKSIGLGEMLFYPYATKDTLQVFPFAPWWKTPRGDVALCGAMASTMWRLFYDKGFNPLRIETF
ncbi:MAG: hypothetical protein HQL21_02135 [Candidatus Omnitrophica bacterium]|nr:hypothetical protein [Candidatus Omnitrophota bacterium]